MCLLRVYLNRSVLSALSMSESHWCLSALVCLNCSEMSSVGMSELQQSRTGLLSVWLNRICVSTLGISESPWCV